MLLTPLPADRFDAWSAAARHRLAERASVSGLKAPADAAAYAARFVTDLLPQGVRTPTSRILMVSDRGTEIGTVWVGFTGSTAFLVDLDVVVSGSSQQDALFDALVRVAREGGVTRIGIALTPQDQAGHALIAGRGFALASIQMLLEPLPERAPNPLVDVRPMTADRFRAFAASSEAAFAADLVASGRYAADEAAAESHRQMTLELPDGVDTPGQSLFTASVDGVEVGVLWVGARLRDDRPHAFVLDVEVAEGQRRKGYGRELMLAAEREAMAIGADSIGLHVFGFNTAAIDLYESLGYRRTEESYLLEL